MAKSHTPIKKAYWRGRWWTIRPATKDEVKRSLDEKTGVLFSTAGEIIYHPDIPDDLKIQAIIHEAGHEMFPEWEKEPDNTSKSELGVFERDMTAFLVAFGVDLSPLIKDVSQ
jgi:hypothetical protein